ncbi:MAG: glycosyltransferase family 39 protein [Lentisphaerae bacterium]|nr:glycosyltransferase family 39 protein [Lentisphaerota bacterium]
MKRFIRCLGARLGRPFERGNRAFALALLAILVVGGLLRFSRLTFQSLWLDELYSMICSRPDVSMHGLLEAFARGNISHPPLYFVILHGWFQLVGFSELAARAFSAVGGVLGLAAIYCLGKEARGKTCGLIACLLALFNYYHVCYSQEARSYIWMFLFSACSLTFLIRYLRRRGVGSLLAYVATALLAMFTHYYGVILVASQLLTAGVLTLAIREGRRERLRRLLVFLLAGITIAVLYLPQILVILRTIPRKRNFWIEAPGGWVFVEILREFFGKDRLLPLACGILSLVAVYAFVCALRGSRGRSDDDPLRVSVPVLLGVVFFGFLIPYICSITSVPMLVTRYEIILLPALLVLMAIGVTTLRHRTVISAVTAGLVFVSAFRLFAGKMYYTKVKKEQWREATQHVLAASEAMHRGKRILYYSRESRRYQLYSDLLGADIRIRHAHRGDLEDRLDGKPGAVDGVWVLRAHQHLESNSFRHLLTNRFTSVHRRDWKRASAEFYVPLSVSSASAPKDVEHNR